LNAWYTANLAIKKSNSTDIAHYGPLPHARVRVKQIQALESHSAVKLVSVTLESTLARNGAGSDSECFGGCPEGQLMQGRREKVAKKSGGPMAR